jgi:hypothetical protein
MKRTYALILLAGFMTSFGFSWESYYRHIGGITYPLVVHDLVRAAWAQSIYWWGWVVWVIAICELVRAITNWELEVTEAKKKQRKNK